MDHAIPIRDLLSRLCAYSSTSLQVRVGVRRLGLRVRVRVRVRIRVRFTVRVGAWVRVGIRIKFRVRVRVRISVRFRGKILKGPTVTMREKFSTANGDVDGKRAMTIRADVSRWTTGSMGPRPHLIKKWNIQKNWSISKKAEYP
jgi:hypothetical protein